MRPALQAAGDDSTNDATLSQTVGGPCPRQPPRPAVTPVFGFFEEWLNENLE